MRDDGAMPYRDWEERLERTVRSLAPQSAVVAFAAAVALFQHLPTVAGVLNIHDATDLLTPLAVVGAALVALLSLRAPPRALVLAFVAAVLFVDGHGIHLSANSIRHDPVPGRAGEVARFWDEQFGHLWWHLGLIGLAGAVCLSDSGRNVSLSRRQAAAIVVLFGSTLFTNTVEGGDWWLALVGAAVFAAWAFATRRPVLTAFAGSFAFAAALIGIWAISHGGVPQFSELGWL
jgi:hypothetical protein